MWHDLATAFLLPLRDFAVGQPQADKSLQWSDLKQEGHESYARMARWRTVPDEGYAGEDVHHVR